MGGNPGLGVDEATIGRYLGIIEQRCLTRRNGAAWQVAAVEKLAESGLDRRAAITRMLELYAEGMHSNEPVHTWPLP